MICTFFYFVAEKFSLIVQFCFIFREPRNSLFLVENHFCFKTVLRFSKIIEHDEFSRFTNELCIIIIYNSVLKIYLYGGLYSAVTLIFLIPESVDLVVA